MQTLLYALQTQVQEEQFLQPQLPCTSRAEYSSPDMQTLTLDP